MGLTLTLNPVAQRKLERAAEERGIRPEQLATEMVERAVAGQEQPEDPTVIRHNYTHQEAMQRLEEYLNAPRPPMPILPDEALTRESLYEGR